MVLKIEIFEVAINRNFFRLILGKCYDKFNIGFGLTC